MAELRPYPFSALLTRLFRELDQHAQVFDFPVRSGFFGEQDRDLSVRVHGRTASSPLGPAAGPHSQMAQNLVLAWMGGSRIFELKTVQIKDDLTIPRPCIDMRTVGYNVEWSQELRLEQSLEEYVKGAMAIAMLRAGGKLPLAPGFDRELFDMSVGYDLAGIQSPKVSAFISGMMDARETVERLRSQIPDELRHLRELEFPTRLSDTLTLSTFHGCPPGEIERIVEHLLRYHRLNCTVKLNPTLLGPARVDELLHEVMGYTDVNVPRAAFEKDASWDQMAGIVDRLGTLAKSLGLSFGVKFTNTLIVENRGDFFAPSEKEMYLSGLPLHVLAMNLAQKFRRQFGDRFPISFSAGIERSNFADAVALNLAPITVCSDLLKPGGYTRAPKYFDSLRERMNAVGARSIPDFVLRAYGKAEEALRRIELVPQATRQACQTALASGGSLVAAAGPELYSRWVAETALLNTEDYVPRATVDPRYAKARNAKPPKKVGSALALFDCLTCGKCVPVCPNGANFAFVLPKFEQPIIKLSFAGGAWARRREGSLTIVQKQQFANFADFCNECGNCDVFCPEDGGPYAVKPRFFGSLEDWRALSGHDGFVIEGNRIRGRIGQREFSFEELGDRARFEGPGFSLLLHPTDADAPVEGHADGEVDLTPLHILRWVRDAVVTGGQLNFLNVLRETTGEQGRAAN